MRGNLLNHISKDLVFDFFECFARFECAMKELPDYCATGRNGRAEPGWGKLLPEVGPTLAPEAGGLLAIAMEYLLANAPMVQVVEDRKAVFRAVNLDGHTAGEKALRAVRRVRNNLFHGGKHTNHSPEEHDENLLRHSIEILEAASKFHPDFRLIYTGLF